jgi:hypothetical protein
MMNELTMKILRVRVSVEVIETRWRKDMEWKRVCLIERNVCFFLQWETFVWIERKEYMHGKLGSSLVVSTSIHREKQVFSFNFLLWLDKHQNGNKSENILCMFLSSTYVMDK